MPPSKTIELTSYAQYFQHLKAERIRKRASQSSQTTHHTRDSSSTITILPAADGAGLGLTISRPIISITSRNIPSIMPTTIRAPLAINADNISASATSKSNTSIIMPKIRSIRVPGSTSNTNTAKSELHALRSAVNSLKSIVKDEFQCPICLETCTGTLSNPECLHRFCGDCFNESLRRCNKECPSCRVHIPTKRSLREDKKFDQIVSTRTQVVGLLMYNSFYVDIFLTGTSLPNQLRRLVATIESMEQHMLDFQSGTTAPPAVKTEIEEEETASSATRGASNTRNEKPSESSEQHAERHQGGKSEDLASPVEEEELNGPPSANHDENDYEISDKGEEIEMEESDDESVQSCDGNSGGDNGHLVLAATATAIPTEIPTSEVAIGKKRSRETAFPSTPEQELVQELQKRIAQLKQFKATHNDCRVKHCRVYPNTKPLGGRGSGKHGNDRTRNVSSAEGGRGSRPGRGRGRGGGRSGRGGGRGGRGGKRQGNQSGRVDTSDLTRYYPKEEWEKLGPALKTQIIVAKRASGDGSNTGGRSVAYSREERAKLGPALKKQRSRIKRASRDGSNTGGRSVAAPTVTMTNESLSYALDNSVHRVVSKLRHGPLPPPPPPTNLQHQSWWTLHGSSEI